VRLSKDGFDFYLDHHGKEGDLKQAMESFELKVDQMEASVFKDLEMILEHEDEHFSYLIDIHVARVHPVGESPITIKIDGLLKAFKSQGDAKALRSQLEEQAFGSQEQHDLFLASKEQHFEAFVGGLGLEIKKVIRTDELLSHCHKKLLRPQAAKGEQSRSVQNHAQGPAVYHGYYGFNDAFFYAWMWSEMMHSHQFHCHNCNIVDHSGQDLVEIGEEGFVAGEEGNDLLNPETDFHEAAHASGLEEGVGDAGELDVGSTDSSGFFDSVFDSSGFGGDDAGSSCGSSCGGGCGGD
jgi:hypothetical protein